MWKENENYVLYVCRDELHQMYGLAYFCESELALELPQTRRTLWFDYILQYGININGSFIKASATVKKSMGASVAS